MGGFPKPRSRRSSAPTSVVRDVYRIKLYGVHIFSSGSDGGAGRPGAASLRDAPSRAVDRLNPTLPSRCSRRRCPTRVYPCGSSGGAEDEARAATVPAVVLSCRTALASISGGDVPTPVPLVRSSFRTAYAVGEFSAISGISSVSRHSCRRCRRGRSSGHGAPARGTGNVRRGTPTLCPDRTGADRTRVSRDAEMTSPCRLTGDGHEKARRSERHTRPRRLHAGGSSPGSGPPPSEASSRNCDQPE